MRKSSALAHFGTQAAVADALDISRAAVSKWGEVVPFESATALEILTDGAIRVDPTLYPAIQRANKSMSGDVA